MTDVAALLQKLLNEAKEAEGESIPAHRQPGLNYAYEPIQIADIPDTCSNSEEQYNSSRRRPSSG